MDLVLAVVFSFFLTLGAVAAQHHVWIGAIFCGIICLICMVCLPSVVRSVIDRAFDRY